jgi:BRCA1-associated protein
MPSYFYHLRIEVYPYPQAEGTQGARSKGDTQKTETEEESNNIFWIPPRETDIFSPEWVGDREDKSTGTGALEFGLGGTESRGEIRRDTKKDWRFGRVSIEAIDMPPPPPAPQPQEQNGGGRENASRVTGLEESARGVMKAEFRPLKTGTTDVGWGVVRLYRDGEESAALSSDVVSVEMGRRVDDAGANAEEGEQGEDCTTLCIPAVPSYLTPSDFLGFVGEKTRRLVSHFRMVMTGRMNRYLVLMKFRDGQAARNWRAEWDGRVFNTMEVSL